MIIVAENEPQQVKLIESPDQNGYGLDALWNDDFHHSAMVALTGRNEAYYTDYLGRRKSLSPLLSTASCIRGNATSGRSNAAEPLDCIYQPPRK